MGTFERCKSGKLTRREFLAGSSSAVVGAGLAPRAAGRVSAPPARSRVVKVKDPASISSDGRTPDPQVVRRMLHAAIEKFTGKDSVEAAWRTVVTPEDIVGLKVNPISPRLFTSHALVNAVVDDLKGAGIPEDNIIIWDLRDAHLDHANFTRNTGTGVKCYGAHDTGGWDEEVHYERDVSARGREARLGNKSQITRILTRKVTKLVNMPILKDHLIPGFTMCLKNLAYGSANNMRRFHGSNCDPAIADVCAMSPIKDKLVLNIADALRCCYGDGPIPQSDRYVWNEHTLFVGTDPVAMDEIGLGIVDQKRADAGLEPMRPRAKYIATAAALGLGINDPDRIDVIEAT